MNHTIAKVPEKSIPGREAGSEPKKYIKKKANISRAGMFRRDGGGRLNEFGLFRRTLERITRPHKKTHSQTERREYQSVSLVSDSCRRGSLGILPRLAKHAHHNMYCLPRLIKGSTPSPSSSHAAFICNPITTVKLLAQSISIERRAGRSLTIYHYGVTFYRTVLHQRNYTKYATNKGFDRGGGGGEGGGVKKEQRKRMVVDSRWRAR